MRHVFAALLCLVAWPAMADCNIQFFARAQEDLDGDKVQLAGQPLGNGQTVTSGNRSGVSPAQARYVGISCTAKTHFRVGGATVVAATTDLWVAQDVLYFTGLWQGGLYVAVLTGS